MLIIRRLIILIYNIKFYFIQSNEIILYKNEIIIRMVDNKNIYNGSKLLEERINRQISIQMQKNTYLIIKSSLISQRKMEEPLETLNKLRIRKIRFRDILLTICLRLNLFINKPIYLLYIVQTSCDFQKLFLKIKIYIVIFLIFIQ
ncbi:transmembrane protein, putative, partial (macronuclear) [Tetrahymena thermophila SB210]